MACEHELAGLAFGVTLQPSTPWWRNLTTTLPPEVTVERPGRTLALGEMLVRVPWRRHHAAHMYLARQPTPPHRAARCATSWWSPRPPSASWLAGSSSSTGAALVGNLDPDNIIAHFDRDRDRLAGEAPEPLWRQPRTACCASVRLSVHRAREEVPVVAGSGDELAAGTGDRNRLRASDADREQVAEVLKTAFVQGRLTIDEFALRVTRAYASRTYADLDALTADIPARLAKAQPPKPAPEPDRKKLIHRGTAVGAGAGMVIPAVGITVAGGSPVFALVFGVLLSTVLAVLLPGFLTLLSWVLDRDTGKQPSQGPPPSACGQAYQPLPPVGPARPSPQISPEPPRAAEARPRRHPRRPLPGLLAGPGLRPAPRTPAA